MSDPINTLQTPTGEIAYVDRAWLDTSFPEVASAMSNEQVNTLLGHLSNAMHHHIEDARMDLLANMRREASECRTREHAYERGFNAASAQSAGLKLALETVTASRASSIASAVAAERLRWSEVLTALAPDLPERVRVGCSLLLETDMRPSAILSTARIVEDRPSPAADFLAAMAVQKVPLPTGAEASTGHDPKNPTPEQRAAFVATVKGMRSPLATGEIGRPVIR